MKRNQSGFTLIEIAIVLVIIGLLLGGVLKGQELINSAKVKNLATDFKNVPIYIYGYQDKYKALPGDDSAATVHLNAASAVNGNGNGIIDGLWKPAAVTDESAQFWAQVRLAGFGPGSTTPDISSGNTYIPKNAVGGDIGVTNAAQSPISTLKGTYIICSNAIPGKFAKQLDTTLDDGNTATGSVQVAPVDTTTPAVLPVPTTGPTGIVDDTTYLVCMGY
jgi:prepilin-type N-terminal cleavage/methylation domain-containing protein